MGKSFKRGGGSYRCKWCGMLKINPGFPKVIGKMYREE